MKQAIIAGAITAIVFTSVFAGVLYQVDLQRNNIFPAEQSDFEFFMNITFYLSDGALNIPENFNDWFTSTAYFTANSFFIEVQFLDFLVDAQFNSVSSEDITIIRYSSSQNFPILTISGIYE